MPNQSNIANLLRNIERVTVMGLGRFGGGAGATRFFAKLGTRVIVTDLSNMEKLADSVATLSDLPVTFHLGSHHESDFINTDLVLANQSARPDHPLLAAARAAGIPVLTETGIALALNQSPWLGVTGSSGKSTTASLLAAMLKMRDKDALFGGNIGGDLLTRVNDHPAASPLAAELSSYQLIHIGPQLANGDIRPPCVAIVTNITPNHLDWHHGFDEYAESKRNLLRHQGKNDWAVLNILDPILADWAKDAPGRVISCSYDDPGANDSCFLHDDRITLRLDAQNVLSLPLTHLRIKGRHNIMNAMQAAAAAFVFFRDAEAVLAGAAGFTGLPHRLETIAKAKGKTFINDSKSTTPESAILALTLLDGPIALIAGGYDKLSPFDKLAATIQREAAALVLVGDSAERLKAAVEIAEAERPAALGQLPIVVCDADFDLAVHEAIRLCPSGGTVLLSPACASWGMFNDFEERGERFRDLALEYVASC